MVAYGLTKRTTDDMESLKSVVGLQHGQSALMLASQRGHTATVQALIGAGADLNLQENCGHTALMLTSPHYTATVQALIGAGADPNVKSEVGVKARTGRLHNKGCAVWSIRCWCN
jgi:predicted ATPase with chaperone activity